MLYYASTIKLKATNKRKKKQLKQKIQFNWNKKVTNNKKSIFFFVTKNLKKSNKIEKMPSWKPDCLKASATLTQISHTIQSAKLLHGKY